MYCDDVEVTAASCSFQRSQEKSSCVVAPLSSDRQHLSYDACLEVRGEIIRTVLCCIVFIWTHIICWKMKH